jgi:hypothetical protein
MCKNGIAKWVVIVTVVFCGCIIWKTLPEHKRHLEEFSKAGARLAGQVCGVRDRDCFSCMAITPEYAFFPLQDKFANNYMSVYQNCSYF